MECGEAAIDMWKIDQPEEQNSALEIEEDKPWFELGQYEEPLIQTVPRILRENEKNKDNFDPKLVSIGPYHYGDPRFELVQTLKTTLVRKFQYHVLFPSSNSTTLGVEALERLMFVDGCFVVYFIYCDVKGYVQMKNDHKSIILMDLLLLENQLPYIFLQALVVEFIPTKLGNDGQDHVNDIIKTFITRKTGAHLSQGNNPPPLPQANQGTIYPKHQYTIHPFIYWIFSEGNSWESGSSKSKNIAFGSNWHSFHSVDELKAAGIKCKTSHSSCLTDIKFQPHRLGTASLVIPTIIIEESFKTKWLNMSAYEACPDFLKDNIITSFLCFKDSLIHHPGDMKELHGQGVLDNLLTTRIWCYGDILAVGYSGVCLKTQLMSLSNAAFLHKRSLCLSVWIMEQLQRWGIWTPYGVVAGVLAFILTTIQTYFSVFPRNTH
ncbi:hypothetical protein NE237_003618 [Protea cynaroides]|uniref:Uncharacterized protein n=1 Tax=Protea cynaroides TaxID=273540 RepID=A0A9Q0KHD9_9MAGN|nr:hypothetical protein NE237_003618 [Protea cynaroides]